MNFPTKGISVFLALSGLIFQTVIFANPKVIPGKKAPAAGKPATLHVSGIPEAKRRDGTPQNVPFVVYLPGNYAAGKKFPVIMEWHGQGGRASVTISRGVTGGNDFICVGMTYVNGKHAAEEKYAKLVYDTIINQYNGNKDAVFAGGFSFGALAQERFLLSKNNITRYKGIWMFGGGFVRPTPSKRWLANTHVFTAVGEKDFNRSAVERSIPRVKQLVKSMDFHIMEGVGHTVDFKNYGPKLLAFFQKHLPEKEEKKDDNDKDTKKEKEEAKDKKETDTKAHRRNGAKK